MLPFIFGEVNLQLLKNKFLFSVFVWFIILILLSLGFWQIYRLNWKLDLINQIENSLKNDPVELTQTNKKNYLRIKTSGQIDFDNQIYLYHLNEKGKPGFEVVNPILIENENFLINRGWIPFDKKDEIDLNFIDDEALTKIEGSLIYSKKRKPLIPDNDISSNVWYLMNTEEMDIVNNLNTSNYLLKITDKNYFPQILIEFEPTKITNNHLQYAGTWFLLALVNTIMYIYFIYRKVH